MDVEHLRAVSGQRVLSRAPVQRDRCSAAAGGFGGAPRATHQGGSLASRYGRASGVGVISIDHATPHRSRPRSRAGEAVRSLHIGRLHEPRARWTIFTAGMLRSGRSVEQPESCAPSAGPRARTIPNAKPVYRSGSTRRLETAMQIPLPGSRALPIACTRAAAVARARGRAARAGPLPPHVPICLPSALVRCGKSWGGPDLGPSQNISGLRGTASPQIRGKVRRRTSPSTCDEHGWASDRTDSALHAAARSPHGGGGFSM